MVKRNSLILTKNPSNNAPQLKIIRIDMSIYFGSVNHIQKRINHILIAASGINFIDLAGTEALISENNRLVETMVAYILLGLKPSFMSLPQN
ncbi:sodium-independent anion transporter [Candidatus Ruthia endofausta]|uniref:sodium-independent anion transporter n=1 Tax=Candidatus Ruthia endofausta TaxID=2738852 RepID=UPI001FE7C247|nr:sodium-independent anion transporter [Candidatus Ruthia endofausta]